MSNITFRGVELLYPDLRRKEASVFVRCHFSAELTKPVSEAMEWGEFPESVANAKLTGELSGDKFILTPTDKKLKDFEIQLQCSRVEDFQLVRKKSEDGESIITSIRFVCIVESIGAIASIEEWMRSVGAAPAALKVTYHEQAELELRGGVTATDEQRQAALEIPVQ